MKKIDEAFVRRINDILIEHDIPIRDRPLETMFLWMQENKIFENFFELDEYDSIKQVYKKIYPNEDFSLAVLKSAIAIRDKMYNVNVPIIFGSYMIDILNLIQIEQQELENIFQKYPAQGWRAYYGVADLVDYAYAVDDLRLEEEECSQLLEQATNNLIATNRILSQDENLDAAVQTICITAELSLKAVLAKFGYNEERRRNIGHNIYNLSKEIVKIKSMNSDDRFLSECSRFPNYVQSRYISSGLSRRQLINLTMRVQFVAAEAVRRISNRNLARELEMDKLNLPRPSFDL